SHVAPAIEKLLPLPHHAKKAVVDDGNVNFDAFLRNRRQFCGGHLKAAVAGYDPYFCLRFSELRTNGSRQCKSHRTQATRGDESPWIVVFVVLGLPHLMLSNIRDDDGFTIGQLPQVVDDVGGVELAVIWQILDIDD